VKGADIKQNDEGTYNLYLYVDDGNGNVETLPVKREGQYYPEIFDSPDHADQLLRMQVRSGGDIDHLINTSRK